MHTGNLHTVHGISMHTIYCNNSSSMLFQMALSAHKVIIEKKVHTVHSIYCNNSSNLENVYTVHSMHTIYFSNIRICLVVRYSEYTQKYTYNTNVVGDSLHTDKLHTMHKYTYCILQIVCTKTILVLLLTQPEMHTQNPSSYAKKICMT